MAYRWVVLAIGTFGQIAFSAVYLGTAVLAPELQRELGLELAETGIVIGAVNFGSLCALVGWGLLVDRYGERRVMTAGLGMAALALAAAAQMKSVAGLVAALVAAGAAGSGVMSATGRAVAGWFEDRQRGLALGLRQTGVPLGGAFAAATLPVIVSAGGVGAAFWFLAGVSAVAAVAGAVWLREPEAHELAADDVGIVERPLRDRRLWSLTVGGALLACAQASVIGFTVLFLHSAHHMSLGSAAAVLASIQALGTIGRIVTGVWSDRQGDRLRPLVGIATATSVTLAATAALASAPLAALLPVLILTGGLAMSWNGLAFTATVEFAGRLRSGAALGLQQSALGGVNAFLPLAFAPLVAGTSWGLGFAVVAALPLAGALVLRPLARQTRAAVPAGVRR
jgi:sugar phosphate permease